MTEARNPVLAHFATYRLTPSFWALSPEDRQGEGKAWLECVGTGAENLQVYLTQGVEAGSDVLIWTTRTIAEADAPARFFVDRARAESAYRLHIEVVHTLWGMTRPSEYSKARSAQEVDPLADTRGPYLIAYPFSKTAEWYLKGRDSRQGMMNEHIRIGKEYQDIKQLLLYSFGLQDQEFVVVYETHDLALFSKLVHDLRVTEARLYTQLDTPLHTGIHMSGEEWVALLG